MQTGKLFVRDRNARAIFCIGFFAAQHPVKDVLPCTENRLIVHRISDNGSLTVNPPATLVVGGFTRRIAYSYGGFANDQLRRLQMGLLRNRVSPEAHKNKFEKRSLERAITGWGKDDIFEISISKDTDEEGKHPLLISCSLNDYPVTSLKPLLKSLTTTIDQYEQPQHPKAQKDAAHINKHAMHIVRLYYTAFDILEKGEIITRRDKEREELLAIRNGKYLREDGSYAPEFFEFVDALEKKFQDDVRKTSLPAKPDFGKIEELLVEINKEYLRRVM